MGTWDVGPFDNDTAADWCDALDAASPDAREGIIRETLIRAAGTHRLPRRGCRRGGRRRGRLGHHSMPRR